MDVINWFLSSKWNQLIFFMCADAIPTMAIQFRIWHDYNPFYREYIDSDSIAFRQFSVPFNLLLVVLRGQYKELNDSAINVSANIFKLLVVVQVFYLGFIAIN
jgi:hypothetical protein